MTLGEMADEGLPISCETDINGAVTLAMLQAVTLGKESSFLADLTIRHPQNAQRRAAVALRALPLLSEGLWLPGPAGGRPGAL